MDVIGKVEQGKYICTVSHSEIEKFLNTYYNGRTKQLEVGEKIDLGRGYDYHSDIVEALNKTEAFISANKKVIEAITTGLTIAVHGQKKGTVQDEEEKRDHV